MVSAVVGDTSGGQNVDWQLCCKVSAGLTSLQEMRNQNKQKYGREGKEIRAGTSLDTKEDNK